MPNLFLQKSQNIIKTWLLMAGFMAIIIALGWITAYYFQSPGIFLFAIIFSIVMNVAGYWFSDRIVLTIAGAKPVSRDEDLELYGVVEKLSRQAGLPVPKIYKINDPVPNAFATGRNKNHAAIAVTSGLTHALSKGELEGVIAHELSHVGNRDILVSTIAAVLVGFVTLLSEFLFRNTMFGRRESRDSDIHPIMLVISVALMILSPIVATLIQLAISRRREFLADASGALLTHNPESLAGALRKIQEYQGVVKRANHATAHLYIANPFGSRDKVSFLSKLFMTHPPTEERIKALLQRNS